MTTESGSESTTDIMSEHILYRICSNVTSSGSSFPTMLPTFSFLHKDILSDVLLYIPGPYNFYGQIISVKETRSPICPAPLHLCWSMICYKNQGINSRYEHRKPVVSLSTFGDRGEMLRSEQPRWLISYMKWISPTVLSKQMPETTAATGITRNKILCVRNFGVIC